MTVIRSLILSSEKKYVVFRHLLFWIVFGVLFHIQNNVRSLFYIGCFLPACLAIVYSLLYVVLPQLQRRHYKFALLAVVAAYAISLLLNVTGSYIFFQTWKDDVPYKMVLGLALHNHIMALCMGGVAFGMKATKSWYQRQAENLTLERVKARNEVELEKANLYPDFILQALESLQGKVSQASDDSTDLLLRLSDTLSYILYDNQVELVDLEKELLMVRNVIVLKNVQWPSCNIHFEIEGAPAGKQVTPLSLFRVVENLFRFIGDEEQVPDDVEVKIKIEAAFLNSAVAAHYSTDPKNAPAIGNIVERFTRHVSQSSGNPCKVTELKDEGFAVSVKLDLINQRLDVNNINTKENVLA